MDILFYPLTTHALKADPNGYAYVKGAALKATDPMGLDALSDGVRKMVLQRLAAIQTAPVVAAVNQFEQQVTPPEAWAKLAENKAAEATTTVTSVPAQITGSMKAAYRKQDLMARTRFENPQHMEYNPSGHFSQQDRKDCAAIPECNSKMKANQNYQHEVLITGGEVEGEFGKSPAPAPRESPIAPPPKPAAETAPPPVDNAAAIQAKTDIVSRTVSPQRQAPHLEATADGGKSYLKPLEDAQKVVDAHLTAPPGLSLRIQGKIR